jgi:SAM-dependent methyltransferase
MGDERTLKAYEKVVAAGMYDTTRAALHRGQDHVRQLWEDQVTRMTLGRFLPPFLEGERPTGSIRVIDLGCGTGEGIRVLSQLRRLPERFTLTEPDLLFSEGLQFYRGVDLSPSMVAKARERYGTHPKLEFEIADLQEGLPVSHDDPPYDIYFSCFGALSHLPDEAMRQLLEGICEHMGEKAVFVADVLGRYSYEWPCYWNGHDSSSEMRHYSIEYVYSPEMLNEQKNGHFPMRYWGGEELGAFVQKIVSERGVRIARQEMRDRSVLVGRHMDTGRYNRRASKIRSAVNSLHTLNNRTDLSKLLFDYNPHPDHPRLNAYFQHLQKAWNAVVHACAQGLDLSGDPERFLHPPDRGLPEESRQAIGILQHVFRQVKGFRMGDPVANLIEPQLGCLLLDLEQALQPGWGAAHGLLGLFELRKDPHGR